MLKNTDLLRNFIDTFLLESSRYEKKTGQTISQYQKEMFEKHVVENSSMATHAFTMTNVEKVGVNPNIDWPTPQGVYFYPLNREHYRLMLEDRLPFASDRKYVGLVELKNIEQAGKWLVFSESGSHSTEEDLQKVLEIFGDREKLKNRILTAKKYTSIDHKIYAILTNEHVYDYVKEYQPKKALSPSVKSSFLLRSLGYVGIYDKDMSIIAGNEPYQIIALDPRAYKVVSITPSAELRSKRESLKDFSKGKK
jgi:hypothetical protein